MRNPPAIHPLFQTGIIALLVSALSKLIITIPFAEININIEFFI